MNLLRRLTQKVDHPKLIDALLIFSIVVMAVIYKLNKVR
jgi:hypothetical protein